jgi:hypothetical protein
MCFNKKIEHRIDLIPSATPPKCTAHRTKPDDKDEMHRPTHALHVNEYVHQSLNPRVVQTTFIFSLDCPIASSPFVRIMQHILKHLVGTIVVSCLDDVLMHYQNLKDRVLYEREVLCILCPFAHKKLISLGFSVSSIGIEVDSLKLEDIHTWLTPTTIAHARSFHIFAILHRNFEKNFVCTKCSLAKGLDDSYLHESFLFTNNKI